MHTAQPHPLIISTHYVRRRHALMALGDFSSLYLDFYLHLADTAQILTETLAAEFKDLLAATCLAAASRPWRERIAWTCHRQNPDRNLFITTDNLAGAVTGTIFTEDIRQMHSELLYCDIWESSRLTRRSVVEISGTALHALELFYQQSEQRPARFFHLGADTFLLLSAQPDCDLDWLSALDPAAAASLPATEDLGFLEHRPFRWHCGCSSEKLIEITRLAVSGDWEEIFRGQEAFRMRCPRCGKRYVFSRHDVLAQ